jgi:hypothetical protein
LGGIVEFSHPRTSRKTQRIEIKYILYLRAFKKYRHDIEGLARRKYFLGKREPDGSVLIRTGEIA